MSRFCGKVGFGIPQETAPGVYADKITERIYRGDITKMVQRLERSEYLNDNISVNNSISIVADAFANENFFSIRYVRWAGACWKVTNVEVQRPRLILTVGGVWNGTTDRTSEDSGDDLP